MGKKLVYAVGALDNKEVENIILCDNTNRTCVVVPVYILEKFPERFPWKDDLNAMKIVKEEISSVPFSLIVLFFVEE